MRQSRVFVDGALIGLVDNPRDLVSRLREMRRCGRISSEINISYKEFNNDVIVHTDRGRARRPLIVVREGLPGVTEEDIERLRTVGSPLTTLCRRVRSSLSMPKRRRISSLP